jgi:hypothetical protein
MHGRFGGKLRIHKRRRGEAEPYEVTPWRDNAVVVGGRERFLDIMRGAATATTEKLGSGSKIDLLENGASVKMIAGTQTGPTSGSNLLTYVWEDSSTDSYTPSQIRVLFPDDTQFAEVTISAGEKPSGDTWTYEYTVKFTYTNPGGYTFWGAGMNHLLLLLAGLSDEYLNDGRTWLELYLSGVHAIDRSLGAPFATGQPNSITREGTTATWRFTFAEAAATEEWAGHNIVHHYGDGAAEDPAGDPDKGTVITTTVSSFGTKPNDRVWHYDWKFSV